MSLTYDFFGGKRAVKSALPDRTICKVIYKKNQEEKPKSHGFVVVVIVLFVNVNI